MTDTVEVDRDYLWALEILAIGRISSDSGVSRKDYKDARRIVKGANLNQPRERHDTNQRGTGVKTEGQRW